VKDYDEHNVLCNFLIHRERIYRGLSSGVVGRGSKGPNPLELPNGVHTKSKNPVRTFSYRGWGWRVGCGVDSR